MTTTLFFTQVDIRFPRGDDEPNVVVIMGLPENVEECKDHLLNLSEEYIQDIAEREDMETYLNPRPYTAHNFLAGADNQGGGGGGGGGVGGGSVGEGGGGGRNEVRTLTILHFVLPW